MTENENIHTQEEDTELPQNDAQADKSGYEIGQHSVRKKQKERKLRKQRKKLNRLKAFLRFFLFLIVVFLIYQSVQLQGWYLRGDVFKIADTNSVNIVNNEIVHNDKIFKSLEPVKIPQLPIFMLRTNQMKRQLLKNSLIKYVYIRRYAFPARIDVIIKERVPLVLLKTDLKSQPVAFFTTDNVLITDKEYMSYPFSKALRVIVVKSPFSTKSWTKKKFQYLDKIMKEVEQYSGEKVQYIDVRTPNDVYIKIPSTNIRLGALDSTVFDRIKRIYTILPKIHDFNGQIRYIDLSWDKVNYIKLK